MADRRRPARPRQSAPSGSSSGPHFHSGVKRRHSDGANAQQRPNKRQRQDRRQDPGLGVAAPKPFAITRAKREAYAGAIIKLRGFDENGPEPTPISVQETVENTFQTNNFRDHRGEIINFDVSIRPNNPPMAFITLPYVNIVDLLFENKAEFTHHGADLTMSRDNKEPDPMLLDYLRDNKYVPVAEARDREALARELQGKIDLASISFGVWARTQTFSPEYTSSELGISAFYNTDRRAVVVEQLGRDRLTRAASRTLVIIPVSDITRAWANSANRTILFHMACPVNYEFDSGSHIRGACFDAEHEVLAPFTSSFILITFPHLIAYQTFCERMRKAPHFPAIRGKHFEVREQRVFDKRHLNSLQTWYRTLPLSIALQCEQAVHGGIISPLDLQAMREKITRAMEENSAATVAAALQDMIVILGDQDHIGRLTSFAKLEQMFAEGLAKALQALRTMRVLPDADNFLCHQLFMTPTGYILEGPYSDRSNRILREYPDHHDHFLRVSFTEEGGQYRRLTKPWKAEFDYEEFINRRIGDTLNNGFFLAGKHWEWLGYSQSALKDRQMIFMTPFVEEDGRFVDSNIIRTDIGIFDNVNKQPAKYGARIAQAFSATSASIRIPRQEIVKIDDIVRNGNCFTDGAGDMSIGMAEAIWDKITRRRLRKNHPPPSAFQARIGGCKGVWMVNPELEGRQLRCSKSQIKFESNSRSFDVASHSERPGITFLNRPLVKLLEDLGIKKETLLSIQAKAVETAETAQDSYEKAAIHFAKNNLGLPFRLPRLFDNLKTILDIDFDSSPQGHIDFYKSVTMLGITSVLRDIKYRARIQVPGPTLIGVCDTWGLLKPKQIYCKVKTETTSKLIIGQVAVTRSPVIHPGDVQLAEAIDDKDVPWDHPIRSLVNVVVFSSKGERSLPSMLGGGDLDGDLFNVLTDPALIPEETEEPGSYEPVPPHKLDRPSQMHDIAEFVCNYVINDIVGKISSQHLAIADFSDLGSRDPECLKLAELASHAVDFVKSGVPVDRKDLPRRLRFTPDFMAREDEKDVYESPKALGEMFRAVPIQKYMRPKGDTQNNVDASVLFKITEAVEDRFPQLQLAEWTSKRAAFSWKAYAIIFCTECEKVAFRNSLSRREDHRLGEEELAVGTTGSLKVESGEMDLMHRARTQMGELVRKMRAQIKDLQEGDEDIEDESVEVESDDEGGTIIVKKEEDQDGDGLLAKLASGEVRIKVKKEPRETMGDGGEDSEIEEIEPDVYYGRRGVKPEPDSDAGSDREDDDDKYEREGRPDWRIAAAGRAYGACVYAMDTLKHKKAKVPFGMRLFSLVAVETLLQLIKTMA